MLVSNAEQHRFEASGGEKSSRSAKGQHSNATWAGQNTTRVCTMTFECCCVLINRGWCHRGVGEAQWARMADTSSRETFLRSVHSQRRGACAVRGNAGQGQQQISHSVSQPINQPTICHKVPFQPEPLSSPRFFSAVRPVRLHARLPRLASSRVLAPLPYPSFAAARLARSRLWLPSCPAPSTDYC